jgi:subtilisin family serine protease
MKLLIRILGILTISLLVSLSLSAKGRLIRAGVGRIENSYLVVLQDDVAGERIAEVARQLASAHGAKLGQTWSHAVKGFAAEMTEAAAEALSRNPLVKFVEEDARWYLSPEQSTNINPITCDPTSSFCAPVVDNRLWHLDRADQNLASPNTKYKYTSDGTGVTVYVVDSGVNKNHQELVGRVQPGYNATWSTAPDDPGDLMPADDPCIGFAQPAEFGYENELLSYELGINGHGTAVASALGGRRIGIAKGVTIVPVKVLRCDKHSARKRKNDRDYVVNETMYPVPNSQNGGWMFRALNSGRSAAADPGGWPTTAGTTKWDGGAQWIAVSPYFRDNYSRTIFLVNGLNWILSPQNTGPKSGAVVTLSTFRLATEADAGAVETAIRQLITSGLTVTASANNQNGNACDTTPARLSANNPDPALRSDVITVGGSMIVNRPWSVDVSDVPGAVEANPPIFGTSPTQYYGNEPAYNPNAAVREARWICGPGDSSNLCSNATSIASMSPTDSGYTTYQGGSNAGPCVTLFAPAKNVWVAAVASSSSYRDARIRGGHASGTSFSAPIVAGLAARVLQRNPGINAVAVRNKLLLNSASTLDPVTLDTYTPGGVKLTGTPNKMLQLGDVNITDQPDSQTSTGPVTLAVVASSVTGGPLTYQWYQVNSGFDLATYNYGAYSSSLISNATQSTYTAPAFTTPKGYWVRVTGDGGSADSTIAVITPSSDTTPPVADFTVSCTELACSFDGRSSSDNVGVVSYAWTFGDNASNSGATTSHTYASRGTYTVTLTVSDGAGLTNSKRSSITVAKLRDAIVSLSVPDRMLAGYAYDVQVTLQNVGSLAWDPVGNACDSYKYGTPDAIVKWGINGRVNLPAPVPPGQQIALKFRVTAPSTPGSYVFDWHIVQECRFWFDSPAPTPTIAVRAPEPKDAYIAEQYVPARMLAGQRYPVTIVLKNAGTTAWNPIGPTCGAFRFGTRTGNYDWGMIGSRVELPNIVAPGESVILRFTVTAPASVGTYPFVWEMVEECQAWFGDRLPVNVEVRQPSAKDAYLVSSNVPTTMVAGASYSVTFVMRNAGSIAWNPVGPACYAYRLATVPGMNTWGAIGGRVELPAPVAAGADVTLQFTVKAPSTPGVYLSAWQIVHECAEWVGDPFPMTRVQVNAP